MKSAKSILILGIGFLVAGCRAPSQTAHQTDAAGRPIAWIGNSQLSAMIYLPDAETGHYRGPRFDWSGMIGSVVVKDQRFFGPLLPGHDNPRSHDYNAVGPADEFGMTSPLGYDQAKAGETFIKIGVGYLVKPAGETQYLFYHDYRVASASTWQVTQSATSIVFRQVLADPRGWGYAYEKSIDVSPNAAELVIHHRLLNTGSRVIDTDQYCHNLVRFGTELTGPGYFIDLPFAAAVKNAEGSPNDVSFADRRLSIVTLLTGLNSAKGELYPLRDQPLRYGATISNGRQAVQIDSAATPSAVKYYASKGSLCYEPFLPVRLAPAQAMEWSVRYRFAVQSDDSVAYKP